MNPTIEPSHIVGDLEIFEVRAKDAAFELYTLSHLSDAEKGQGHAIAEKLLAIAALLPALRGVVSSSRSSAPGASLFGAEHTEALAKGYKDCELVLDKIEESAKKAEEWVGIPSRKKSMDAKAKVLPEAESEIGNEQGLEGKGKMKAEEAVSKAFSPYPGDEEDALRVLGAYFRNITTALSVAREEYLGQRGFLTDDEVFESSRLTDALQHPNYTKAPELPIPPSMHPTVAWPKNLSEPQAAPTAFPRPPSPPPYQPRWVIELQHPRGFRGRYGHPDYPHAEKRENVQLWPEGPSLKFEKSFEESETERSRLRDEGKYPDIASFGIWPPNFVAKNSVQDIQLKEIMAGNGGDRKRCVGLAPLSSSLVGTPVPTPISTRASSPDVESDKKTTFGVGENQNTMDPSHSIAQVQSKSTFKLTTEEHTKEGDLLASHKSVCTPCSTDLRAKLPVPPIASTIATHLEAYILQPVSESIWAAIECSHRISPLPLAPQDIDAHIQTLGPNHSVINDIRQLDSEQLSLINNRVKQREGTLMSAQLGKEEWLSTKMGSLLVRSVVFIIRTEQTKEKRVRFDLEGNSINPPLFGPNTTQTASAFGGFGRNSGATSGFGSFGSFPNNSAPTSGFGAFGCNRASTTGFGVFGGNSASTTPAFGAPGTNPTTNPFSSGGTFGATQSTQTTGGFAFPPPFPSPCEPTDIERYRQRLQENGEICTFVEAAPPVDKNRYNHFQTITPTLSKDVSFEELRQVDTEAGRTGPAKMNGFSYPWDQGKPRVTGGYGLFGSKPMNVVEGGHHRDAAHPQQDAVQPQQGWGGLFGTGTPSAQPPTRSTDIFGRPLSTANTPSGGLFGNSSTQNNITSGSWFGPGTVKRGLFDTATQTVSQPSSGIFGAAKPSSSALFGGIGIMRNDNQTTTGLFGNAQTTSPATSGGLFGSIGEKNTKPPVGGLFGNTEQGSRVGNAPHTSLFGSTISANMPLAPKGFENVPTSQCTIVPSNPFGTSASKANVFDNSTSRDPAGFGALSYGPISSVSIQPNNVSMPIERKGLDVVGGAAQSTPATNPTGLFNGTRGAPAFTNQDNVGIPFGAPFTSTSHNRTSSAAPLSLFSRVNPEQMAKVSSSGGVFNMTRPASSTTGTTQFGGGIFPMFRESTSAGAGGRAEVGSNAADGGGVEIVDTKMQGQNTRVQNA